MTGLSKWLVIALIVVLTASIGAITLTLQLPAPSPESTPAHTPETTQPPHVKLRISYQPSWHHAAFFVMVEKGWLNRVLGGQVEVIMREIATGPDQMNALVAGELDIVYVGATPPLPVIAGGFKAKVVAVANTEGSALVVKPDLDYRDPTSLIGKTVSTYPPGSIQHTLMTYWLKKSGIDPGRVNILGQTPADQLVSFAARAVDAILTPDPHTYTAVLEHGGRIAVTSGEMWPNHPCCVLLMTEDVISKHRDLVVKFVALHIIASEYTMDPKNSEEVKRVLLKWLPIKVEVAAKFPGSTKFHTDPRDPKWREGMDLMCQVLHELGRTKDAKGQLIRLKVEDVVDTSIYEEALNMLPQIKAQLGL